MISVDEYVFSVDDQAVSVDDQAVSVDDQGPPLMSSIFLQMRACKPTDIISQLANAGLQTRKYH